MKLAESNKMKNLYAIETIIWGIIIIPVLIVSLYSLPVADDFSNAVMVRTCSGGTESGTSYLVVALNRTLNAYKTWGGVFFL